jgi:flavin reductase (DIM6/NTAB) family NADH-FMN oxidoreductase RutF
MDSIEHDTIPASSLRSRDSYRLMTDIVVPRPIAWVSTLDDDGRPNLAPFSFFQGVCSSPPTVVLGVGWHGDGRPKDTLRNILARREFTVSHVSEPLADAMNATAAAYPSEVSEWAAAGPGEDTPLASAPATMVAPPRVAAALAALECRMVHAIPLGRGSAGNPSTTLVVAEILVFSVAKGLVTRDEAGHVRAIDPAHLATVGRMGGMAYTKTAQTFEMGRPKPGSSKVG